MKFNAMAGVEVTGKFEAYGKVSTECFLRNPKVCAGVSLSADVFAGIKGGGEVSYKLGTESITTSFEAKGGVSSGLSGKIEYCSDTGWGGQACFKGVKAEAGYKFEAKLQSGAAYYTETIDRVKSITLVEQKCKSFGGAGGSSAGTAEALPAELAALDFSDLMPEDPVGIAQMLGYASPAAMLADVSGSGVAGALLADGVETTEDLQAALNAADAMRAAAEGGRVGLSTRAVSADARDAEMKARAAAGDGGVCAHVRLNLEQQAVMTRKVFAGTLDITNYHTQHSLDDLNVRIDIYDVNGNLANDKFVVLDPELTNLVITDDGDPPPGHDPFEDGLWIGQELMRLEADTTGRARWIIVPTEEAAADGPTSYTIGGYMTYDINGVGASADLEPAPVTVWPDAKLDLKYFWQRDVYSDDPFTESVEPSVPFSVGVMVVNHGQGAAKDFRIESAQPKIVENVKGLLIDFEIIGSDVNGQAATPSLTVDFGTIDPGDVGVARWLMTSTLQGHFIEYNASFRHTDELGGERTSLIEDVSIFELIRVVAAGGAFDDGLHDFLTNELEDPTYEPIPDTLHLSDGTVAPVSAGSDAVVDGPVRSDDLEVILTASMSPEGWSYVKVGDPGGGLYRVDRVVRLDAAGNELGELPAPNAWQTDRSYKESRKRPVYEDMLHLLDYESTGRYKLVYEAIDTTPPELVDIEEPASPLVAEDVSEIPVVFSEPIDLATFSRDDLHLVRRTPGGTETLTLPAGVTIRHIEGGRYLIEGLADLTDADGEYTLTVDGTGVTDFYANAGTDSLSASWFRAKTLPTVASIIDAPTGVVNRPAGTVYVKFTQPIDPTTFDSSNLTLTCDGQVVPVTGDNVTVTPITAANDVFRISGLDELTSPGCTYVLTVSAEGVENLSGQQGIGQESASWEMDVDAPYIASVTDEPTGVLTEDVASVELVFSEPLAAGTFGPEDLTLSRDGGDDLIDGGVAIAHVGGSTYRIDGLGGLTDLDGQYVLTVDSAGVTDAVGNAGVDTRMVAWTRDGAPPVAATDLAVTPDTGVADDDAVTAATTLTLTGTVGEAGLGVRVRNLTNGRDLGEADVTGTSFSLTFDEPLGGRYTLEVTVYDDAGNATPTTFDVVLDLFQPAVDGIEGIDPLTTSPTDSLDVVFTEPIAASMFDLDDVTLTRDGTEVDLAAAGAAIEPVGAEGTTFRLAGLGGATGEVGEYAVTVDARGVEDLAGNPGTGPYEAGWTFPADQAAPVVTSVEIQGGQQQRYLVDTLSITFNEATNVGDLIDAEILVSGDAAMTVTNLGIDANHEPDAPLALGGTDKTAFAWDADTHTLTWMPADPLADGYYELRLAADAVLDTAENPLDGDGAGGDFVLNFHVLDGDVDGDRNVDNDDRALLDLAMGSADGLSRWDLEADLDRDGRVTILDVLRVLRNHGRQVEPEVPARVEEFILQDGQDQRHTVGTFDVLFSEETALADMVAAGTVGSALTLTNLGVDADADPDTPVTLDEADFAWDAAAHTLTWQADAGLDDGYYELRLDAEAVTDGAESPLAGGDFVTAFHVLGGDADGDLGVDGDDLAIVDAAMDTAPGNALWNVEADLTGDGLVDAADRQAVLDATGDAVVPPSGPSDTGPSGPAETTPTPSTAPDAEAFGDVGDYATAGRAIDLTAYGTSRVTWVGGLRAGLDGYADTDWYTVTAPASGTLKLTATWGAAGGELPDLTLYEMVDDGWTLGFEDAGAGSAATRVVGGRDYYLRVDGDRGLDYGDEPLAYRLAATLAEYDAYLPLIGADVVLADSGLTGEGIAVAVIDTGVDYNHPALGGRVILGPDFGADDADPMDTVGHGTHVAGLIASADDHAPGLLPDADVVALKVTADGSTLADVSDIADALQWVLDHGAEHNVAAVNISFALGNGSAGQELAELDGLYEDLAAKGVFVAAASGNDYAPGVSEGVSLMALGEHVAAVGAVWEGDRGEANWGGGGRDYTSGADRLISFSQRSADVAMVAPGGDILGLAAGGGLTVRSGTSMAAPLVTAAAVATGQAAARAGQILGADALLGRLQAGATVVFDGDDENDNVANSHRDYFRLDLLGTVSTFDLDDTGRYVPVWMTAAHDQLKRLADPANASAGRGERQRLAREVAGDEAFLDLLDGLTRTDDEARAAEHAFSRYASLTQHQSALAGADGNVDVLDALSAGRGEWKGDVAAADFRDLAKRYGLR